MNEKEKDFIKSIIFNLTTRRKQAQKEIETIDKEIHKTLTETLKKDKTGKDYTELTDYFIKHF